MTYESIKDVNISKNQGWEVMAYIARVTEYWFTNLILIGIFIIFTFAVYRSKRDLLEAFAVGGFFTALTSIFFWWAKIVSGETVVIAIVSAIVFFGLMWFTKKAD